MEKPQTDFLIRVATSKDIPTILSLIKALAEYEKEPQAVTITPEELLRDGFCDQPFYRVFIAEEVPKNPHTEVVVYGFALYFYTYSTWKGRVLYLEDLFVKQEYRRKGIGLALLKRLAKEAKDNKCVRLIWQVLDWNQPSIEFYKAIGGMHLKDWQTYRMGEEEINRFLSDEYKNVNNGKNKNK